MSPPNDAKTEPSLIDEHEPRPTDEPEQHDEDCECDDCKTATPFEACQDCPDCLPSGRHRYSETTRCACACHF